MLTIKNFKKPNYDKILNDILNLKDKKPILIIGTPGFF
jgi:hypothetical protein